MPSSYPPANSISTTPLLLENYSERDGDDFTNPSGKDHFTMQAENTGTSSAMSGSGNEMDFESRSEGDDSIRGDDVDESTEPERDNDNDSDTDGNEQRFDAELSNPRNAAVKVGNEAEELCQWTIMTDIKHPPGFITGNSAETTFTGVS